MQKKRGGRSGGWAEMLRGQWGPGESQRGTVGCVGMAELHKSGRGGRQLAVQAHDDFITQL